MGGLFGTWYFLKTGNEKAEEREEQANAGDEIINMPAEDAAAVSFEIAGETYSFVREEGSWKLDGEEHFTGDEDAFSTLLGHFAPLRANRTLDGIEDISEFGLDEPVNTFTLTGTDGSSTVLLIGDNNEGTGDDYALKADDENTVYTISTALRDSIGEDLIDYAAGETLPSFSSDAVVRVEVQRDTEAYVLAKEEDEWTMEDFPDRLDQEAAEDIISELGYINYRDYVSYYCEDISQYGLDSGYRITITYEDGTDEIEENPAENMEESQTGNVTENMTENETESTEKDMTAGVSVLSLLIGNQDENGDYYVQQEGSREVHTLSGSMIDSFLALDTQGLKEPETEAVSEAYIETFTEDASE